MLFAVTANNVGIMWIAIEATTIISALLIPLHVTQASVEASWKYILIGSVGIALAFAGTVLGYFDFVTLAGRPRSAQLAGAAAAAPSAAPEVMKLAFVFLLVGYGTKAGIAPMHTWKPDAYWRSARAVSRMMSGVLFAVAMYASCAGRPWRTPRSAGFTDKLLLGARPVVPRDRRIQPGHPAQLQAHARLLERRAHGVVCIGLGLGPLGVFAAMLHLLNHTLAKSLMFFSPGASAAVRVAGDRRVRACSRCCHGPAGCSPPGCWR